MIEKWEESSATFEFKTVLLLPCGWRGGMLRGRAVLEGAGSENGADEVGLNFKLFRRLSAMGNDPLREVENADG